MIALSMLGTLGIVLTHSIVAKEGSALANWNWHLTNFHNHSQNDAILNWTFFDKLSHHFPFFDSSCQTNFADFYRMKVLISQEFTAIPGLSYTSNSCEMPSFIVLHFPASFAKSCHQPSKMWKCQQRPWKHPKPWKRKFVKSCQVSNLISRLSIKVHHQWWKMIGIIYQFL